MFLHRIHPGPLTEAAAGVLVSGSAGATRVSTDHCAETRHYVNKERAERHEIAAYGCCEELDEGPFDHVDVIPGCIVCVGVFENVLETDDTSYRGTTEMSDTV